MKERVKTFRGTSLRGVEDEVNKWMEEGVDLEFIGASITCDMEIEYVNKESRKGTIKGVRKTFKDYKIIYIILITYR